MSIQHTRDVLLFLVLAGNIHRFGVTRSYSSRHSYALLTCTHMYTHAHMCRELVHCLAMTACDICSTCKPWEVHRDGVEDLFNEFYHQVWLDVRLAVGVHIVCIIMYALSGFHTDH